MTRSNVQDLPDLNGLLVIDKPVGLTSHDVVSRVRRLVGMKRVGHGGTLDPFATGVLVVGVGRATRVLQLVQDSDKAYRALIAFGASTDSADIEGALLARGDPEHWPDRAQVDAALDRFVGTIEQVPPTYSAIKVGGRKLYELARAGERIEAPSRTVTIHAIELIAYTPPWLEIGVRCAKGTYIRSLARDIGEALGFRAYCHALRRTQNGPFCLADAWTLDELSACDVRADWPEVATHPDAALQALPVALLSEEQTGAWYHGRSVPLTQPTTSAATVRVYGADGRLVGVGSRSESTLVPTLVIPREDREADGDEPANRRD